MNSGKKTPYQYTANDNFNFLKQNAASVLEGNQRGQGQDQPLMKSQMPKDENKVLQSKEVLKKIVENQEYIQRQKRQAEELYRLVDADENNIYV